MRNKFDLLELKTYNENQSCRCIGKILRNTSVEYKGGMYSLLSNLQDPNISTNSFTELDSRIIKHFFQILILYMLYNLSALFAILPDFSDNLDNLEKNSSSIGNSVHQSDSELIDIRYLTYLFFASTKSYVTARQVVIFNYYQI